MPDFNMHANGSLALSEFGKERFSDEEDSEKELRTTIAKFRDDELEHRDIAIDHDGREARHYTVLRNVIQQGCRTAIKIAEKF